jgi:hypothetical protein
MTTRLPGTNPMRSGAIAALWVEKLRTGRGADERRASRSVRSIAVCISKDGQRDKMGGSSISEGRKTRCRAESSIYSRSNLSRKLMKLPALDDAHPPRLVPIGSRFRPAPNLAPLASCHLNLPASSHIANFFLCSRMCFRDTLYLDFAFHRRALPYHLLHIVSSPL